MKVVLWLDPNIDWEENSHYFDELTQLVSYKIYRIKTVDEAINQINEILFEETIIIVSGKLFKEFIIKFEKNLNNLCLMPNIIIFTANRNEFLQSLGNYIYYINNSFYNSGGVKCDFSEVLKFVKNPKKKKDPPKRENEEHFSFDYIDTKEKLAMPIFYKCLIEFTEKDNIEFIQFLNDKYYNQSKEIKKFIDSINSIPDIPIQLLAKYYARIFTDEDSSFYKHLNEDLRKNKREKYLTFIKVLYEGVKLKSLPLAENKELFRGTYLAKSEIKKFIEYNNKEKINNLPGSIVFSKTFLSFTKDKEIAYMFIEQTPKNASNLFKVIFTLENEIYSDNNINYSLSTHADIEKISLMPDEREVLFFPFSSFEIKDINPKDIKDIKSNEPNKIFEIRLLYLGKYLREIEGDKNIVENKINLPETEFTKELEKSGLIEKEKVVKNNTKELYQKFREKKANITKIKNPIYQEAPIYPISPIPRSSTLNKKTSIQSNTSIHPSPIYPNYRRPYIIRRLRKNEKKVDIYNPPTPKISMIKAKKPIAPIEINENNSIIGYFNIGPNDLQKGIRVINSFEQTKRKANYIKVDNELRYKNEQEIIDNCRIKINNKEYKFNYFYNFSKPGIYTIEYLFKKHLTKTDFMFAECYNLIDLDLINFDTRKVINMVGMFLECLSLRRISISNLDTHNINDMNCMFCGCQSLTNLDLSSFNTQNVVNMSRVFFGCKSLESINLASFNTQNVIDMYAMFGGCESLKSLDLLNFYTQNIKNMSSMFFGCRSLIKLNLSNFRTDNVVYMNRMFYGCSSLQILDISNFNFDKVINKEDMFSGCFSLKVERINCKQKNILPPV